MPQYVFSLNRVGKIVPPKKQILKDISLSFFPGAKIGVLGLNGAGKSTLLKIMAGVDKDIEGEAVPMKGLKIGYLPQEPQINPEFTVRQAVEEGMGDVINAQKRLEEVYAEYAEPDADFDKLAAEQAELEAIISAAGTNAETQMEIAADALRLPPWDAKIENLSGGEKRRVALCRLLLSQPEMLLLDEPTNHLDIVMSEWLEKYLREFRGGVLIISHDRAFLDAVVEGILEMEGGTLHRYKGNYSRYVEQKELQVLSQTRAYEAQQETIRRTEEYIRRYKAGIKSKMARGRQSQLDRMERIDAPVKEESFTLRLPHAAESAEKVIMLEHLSVGYEGNALLSDIDLVLRRGEKVAIIGPNGSGKSTLLKTILQEIPPLHGEAKIGNRVKIGYFSQSYERLDSQQTILDNFLTEYGMTDEQTRRLLGSMLFRGEDVYKTIGSLSGGQKARLVLLKLVLDGANCLVLDEPTNHLDIMAKEAVEAALETFDGTVLLVTHDRYLVNEVAGRIWAVEKGHLTNYNGNYDFYLEERDKRQQREAPLPESSHRAPKEEPVKPDGSKHRPHEEKSKNQRIYTPAEAEKLLPEVELKIREHEALQKVLSQQIADPENQMDLEKSAALAAEYEKEQQLIDGFMEKWEALMEALE